MALAVDHQHDAGRYWTVPLARAAVAIVIGCVVTFSPDHSPSFGLLVFGAFALVTGIGGVALDRARLSASVVRTLLVAKNAFGAVSGLVALIVWFLFLGELAQGGSGSVASAATAELGFFVYIVLVWAAVTGVLELYAGLRAARLPAVAAFARDWLIVGIGTAILALVFLVIPPHPVVSVGLLGAYAIVLGVFLGIAAFSLKWAAADDARAAIRSSEGFPADGRQPEGGTR